MALYPSAAQRPWHPYSSERFITPTQVIVHTNACNSEDPGPTGTLSWHFQVGQAGTVYQHRDTRFRAAANAAANNTAVSIETWDGGDPEGNPWNADQIDALVALIGWVCDEHGIPRSVPTAWDAPGVGFHRMYSAWNNPVHSCPGNTRAAQFYDVILPRLQETDDMFTDDDRARMARIEAKLDANQATDDATNTEVGRLGVVIRDPKTGIAGLIQRLITKTGA